MTDPRHIILASDGRTVTLGRYTAPDADSLASAGAHLATQGLGGWYCIQSASSHGCHKVTITLVGSGSV